MSAGRDGVLTGSKLHNFVNLFFLQALCVHTINQSFHVPNTTISGWRADATVAAATHPLGRQAETKTVAAVAIGQSEG